MGKSCGIIFYFTFCDMLPANRPDTRHTLVEPPISSEANVWSTAPHGLFSP